MIARKERGIRRNGSGWQAYVTIGGRFVPEQFPYDTPLEIMRAWRERQKAGAPKRGIAGSLAADVETFLAKPEIAAQAYVHQTARYLRLWLEVLDGERARATFTRDELEAVIQQWLTTLAEPTVYHRRAALVRLYNVLDPHGVNVAEQTTCPQHWIKRDRSIPHDILEAILAAMPAERFVKPGIRRPSIARLVSHVVATVGIRPGDLHKIRRADLNWPARMLQWPASEKGAGVPARWVRFTAAAERALRAFDAADAYGKFSVRAVSKCFKRAARRVDGDETPHHLYGGRHTHGKRLYEQTADLATVGRLLGHAKNSRATAQYAAGADDEVNRKAIALLDAADKKKPAKASRPTTIPEVRRRRATARIRAAAGGAK